MGNNERTEWVHDQLREQGWSEGDISRGKKYTKGRWQVLLGGLLCIFVITAPIGLPLFILAVYRIIRYKDPGEEYYSRRESLKKEFGNGDGNGLPN